MVTWSDFVERVANSKGKVCHPAKKYTKKSMEAFDRIYDLAEGSGITFYRYPIGAATDEDDEEIKKISCGIFYPEYNAIWLEDYTGSMRSASILMHEIAHFFDKELNGDVRNYVDGEVVAETVAMLVMKYLGINTWSASAAFIGRELCTDLRHNPYATMNRLKGDIYQIYSEILSRLR